MLAMREGQPCLVNRTGGLRDTVEPGVNGFAFEGSTLEEQIDNMAIALAKALTLHEESSSDWKKNMRRRRRHPIRVGHHGKTLHRTTLQLEIAAGGFRRRSI